MKNNAELQALAQSQEPAIRFLTATRLQDLAPSSRKAQRLQRAIPDSPSVRSMLALRDAQGCLPYHAYQKWLGAHWTLAVLADLGYPAGDEQLIPLYNQVMAWLFSDEHRALFKKRTLAGRVRMHPSQEGNAIYYALMLGLDDERVDQLVERILGWRWPDGGWNCSMKPEAHISSFMETLIPLRGLALYGKRRNHAPAQAAAREAAEIFLKRQLFKRQRTGSTMNPDFVALHFPCYWHYDILFGLKVMAEADLLEDARCDAALDLLASKRLPAGGFPAEKKYYQVGKSTIRSRSAVDWGGTHKKKMNVWVTLEALAVLKRAGRISF